MIDRRPRLIARCVDVGDVIRRSISRARTTCSSRFAAAATTRRLRRLRRRPGHRPLADALRSRRSAEEDGPRRRRCAVGRRRSRRPRLRTRRAGRHHLDHRCRRAHPGRRHRSPDANGLTIDNLLRSTWCSANGKFVMASPKENTDLFWAVRGGGGNFGVVTSFVFKGTRSTRSTPGRCSTRLRTRSR